MKTLQANWREIVFGLLALALLFLGILSLGSPDVANNGPLSTLVSIAVELIGITMKYVLCLGLAWVGLSVTFPEAAKFLLGNRFDNQWDHMTDHDKMRVTLIGAAVLGIIAALCVSSS